MSSTDYKFATAMLINGCKVSSVRSDITENPSATEISKCCKLNFGEVTYKIYSNDKLKKT